jgi:hypothetical protein
MNIATLSPSQLRKAADIQEKIESLRKKLNEILGAVASSPVEATEAPRKKYKFSAAARAKMRAAQKARWAKINGAEPSAKPAQKRKKRKMSAQGLANIRAGVAKRLAKAKKAAK